MKRILYICGVATILSTSSQANLLNDLLSSGGKSGGDIINGLIGKYLNFGGVPGLENITVTCNDPGFSLPSIPEIDTCAINDPLKNLLKIPDIPSFDLNIGGCSLSVGLIDNTPAKCVEKYAEQKCRSIKFDTKDFNFGIDSTGQVSKILLSVFGGKGVYGKNECADSPKRLKVYNTPSMTSTYGDGGNSMSNHILFAPEVGGSPSNLNRRKTQRALTCIEAARRNKQDESACYLNNRTDLPDTEEEVEKKIIEAAKPIGTPLGAPPSNTPSSVNDAKIQKYWKLFYQKAKKYGIKNWKTLMAIGMHESGLNPTIDGAVNGDGTRDYGMMQINSCWAKDINKRYGAYGGFWAALHLAEPSVDFGAYVLSDCEKRFGPTSPKTIDCYNKGARNAHYPSKYVDLVKQQYQKIKDINFGVPDEPFAEDVKIAQRASATAFMAFMATQHQRTMTHLGEDMVKMLPKHKQLAYIEMVQRHMAQKAFILASYKRASDIEKTIYHINDVDSGVSAGIGLDGTVNAKDKNTTK